MRQALHIFTKDIRYLKYEIVLVLAIDMVFAAMHVRKPSGLNDSWWAELALVVASAFLIGRLVLAEAIPGDRQFWITRPYRWQSLLRAKLLFIVAFVNLPIFAAHIFILILDRFPLVSSLPGLCWTQLLLFTFVSLPFAALAALTSGVVPFIFSQLVLLAVGFSILELLPSRPLRLGGVEWITDSVALVALGATAVPVLLIQYKSRRTWFSRWFALSGAALGAIAFLAIPWPTAFAVQSFFSKQASLGSSIAVKFGSATERQYFAPAELHFPLLIEGIPDGTEIQPDGLTVSILGSDASKTDLSVLDCPDLRRSTISTHSAVLYATCLTTHSGFLDQKQDHPVTIRASFYFTLFGNARSKTIPLSSKPSNALDGLQCYTAVAGAEWDVYCRSAFRWPARLVYAKLGHTNANSFAQFVSYSPFPASLNIDPFETRWASAYAAGPPPDVRDVTIIVEEPLAHLRRDVEARDVRLSQSPLVLGVPPQSGSRH